LIKALRPKQWTKNGLLFAALIFSGNFVDPDLALRAFLGFTAFCLVSSSGYVLNDTLDREADRQHPKKRHRPIASGIVAPWMALILMVIAFSTGLALAASLSWWFLAIAVLYLVTTLSYSFVFKHMVILDVMFISAGFVWRAIAGAVVIDVKVSAWFFLCAAFLALFIGFNKRRAELTELGDGAGTRRNLAEYSTTMLDQLQAIVTGPVVLCYALYTVLGANTPWMVVTVPVVLYGIFRFVYLVDKKGEGAAPDETLVRDAPLLLTVVVYVLMAGSVIQLDALGLLPDVDEIAIPPRPPGWEPPVAP
jgi:4-hydroxybenzoate polyprenyltransferase